jgi:hypothetical protein
MYSWILKRYITWASDGSFFEPRTSGARFSYVGYRFYLGEHAEGRENVSQLLLQYYY